MHQAINKSFKAILLFVLCLYQIESKCQSFTYQDPSIESEIRIGDLLYRLSLQDKINLLYGHSEEIKRIERLNIDFLKFYPTGYPFNNLLLNTDSNKEFLQVVDSVYYYGSPKNLFYQNNSLLLEQLGSTLGSQIKNGGYDSKIITVGNAESNDIPFSLFDKTTINQHAYQLLKGLDSKGHFNFIEIKDLEKSNSFFFDFYQYFSLPFEENLIDGIIINENLIQQGRLKNEFNKLTAFLRETKKYKGLIIVKSQPSDKIYTFKSVQEWINSDIDLVWFSDQSKSELYRNKLKSFLIKNEINQDRLDLKIYHLLSVYFKHKHLDTSRTLRPEVMKIKNNSLIDSINFSYRSSASTTAKLALETFKRITVLGPQGQDGSHNNLTNKSDLFTSYDEYFSLKQITKNVEYLSIVEALKKDSTLNISYSPLYFADHGFHAINLSKFTNRFFEKGLNEVSSQRTKFKKSSQIKGKQILNLNNQYWVSPTTRKSNTQFIPYNKEFSGTFKINKKINKLGLKLRTNQSVKVFINNKLLINTGKNNESKDIQITKYLESPKQEEYELKIQYIQKNEMGYFDLKWDLDKDFYVNESINKIKDAGLVLLTVEPDKLPVSTVNSVLKEVKDNQHIVSIFHGNNQSNNINKLQNLKASIRIQNPHFDYGHAIHQWIKQQISVSKENEKIESKFLIESFKADKKIKKGKDYKFSVSLESQSQKSKSKKSNSTVPILIELALLSAPDQDPKVIYFENRLVNLKRDSKLNFSLSSNYLCNLLSKNAYEEEDINLEGMVIEVRINGEIFQKKEI